MRFRAFLRFSVLPLLLLCIPAIASAQQTIRCESNNGGRQYCNIGNANPNFVTMQRQISGSPCTQNVTWGIDGSGLWVDRGCRAEFNIGRGGPGPGMPGPGVNTIKCESNDGRRNYCNTGYIDARQVTIAQQISGSPCSRGSTWGVDPRGLWVDRGCRAIFNIANWDNGGGPGGGWWTPGPGPTPWPPSGNWQGGNWGHGGACLYSDRDFGGKYVCLRRGESRTELGDLGDDVSSIRVFGGARVIVYNDRNFSGPSAASARDIADLRNWSYGGGHTWNNRISSVRVQ